MGVVPITLVDTVYPQALEWNSKLKSDTKLDTLPSTLDISGSAALSSSCPVVSHSVKPEAVKDTSSLRYAALVGIGAVLLFAPKEVEGPVFAAVALMTSVLLFCLRPRLQSITTLQNKAKNGIELLTMRQLDEIVMLRGGKKCECGFIKVSSYCNAYIIS